MPRPGLWERQILRRYRCGSQWQWTWHFKAPSTLPIACFFPVPHDWHQEWSFRWLVEQMKEALRVRNDSLLSLDLNPLPLYNILVPLPSIPGERLP